MRERPSSPPSVLHAQPNHDGEHQWDNDQHADHTPKQPPIPGIRGLRRKHLNQFHACLLLQGLAALLAEHVGVDRGLPAKPNDCARRPTIVSLCKKTICDLLADLPNLAQGWK